MDGNLNDALSHGIEEVCVFHHHQLTAGGVSSLEELEAGTSKFYLTPRSGAQPLGPVPHACVTLQAPRGRPGPGTMGPAVTPLPPSSSPPPLLPQVNCLGLPPHGSFCPLGAFLSNLNVAAGGETPDLVVRVNSGHAFHHNSEFPRFSQCKPDS